MPDRGIIFSAPMVRALLEGRKTQTRRVLRPPEEGAEVISDGADRLTWHVKGVDHTHVGRRPYAVGDRLYVREAIAAEELSRPPKPRRANAKERQHLQRTSVIECDELDGADGVRYLADDAWVLIDNTQEAGDRWFNLFHYACKDGERPAGHRGRSVPSIHMPRWASRLWLLVTDVRVQRLHPIGSADAIAEGIEPAMIGYWRNYREPRVPLRAPESSYESLWDTLHAKPGESWADNPWIVALTFEVKLGNIDRIGVDG